MKKFSVFSVQLSVLVVSVCLCASVVNAQSPRVPESQSSKVEAAKPAPSADAPKPVPTPEFLKDYEKLLTLAGARANAEKRRAEYEATVKVLTEQIEDVTAGLNKEMNRLAPGCKWGAAKRAFDCPPAPVAAPAKPEEKKKE